MLATCCTSHKFTYWVYTCNIVCGYICTCVYVLVCVCVYQSFDVKFNKVKRSILKCNQAIIITTYNQLNIIANYLI